jgi:hypothetical protein
MATYAVVNNTCVECHTPDHSTATHDGDLAYTVLGTRLGVPTPLAGEVNEAPHLVRVKPHGQLLRTLRSVDDKTLLMMPGRVASNAGAYLMSSLPGRPVIPGVEIRDVTAKGGKQYKVFLRSSNKSRGGMKTARQRVQSHWGEFAQTTTPAQSSVPDRAHSAITVPDASGTPQVQKSNTPLQVPVNIVRRAISVPEAQDRIILRETATYLSATPGRPLSESDLALRRLNFYTSGARDVYTRSENSIQPSLAEDAGHYQLDDTEETSGLQGLLHDLGNYGLDDDVWEAAGPSAAEPNAKRPAGPSAAEPSAKRPTITSTSNVWCPTNPTPDSPDTVNTIVLYNNNSANPARTTDQNPVGVGARANVMQNGSPPSPLRKRTSKASRLFQNLCK